MAEKFQQTPFIETKVQQQSKQKSMADNIILIVIGILVIFILSYKSRQQVIFETKSENNGQDLYLRVWQNGHIVRLAYRPPQIINFEKINESKQTQLTISEEQFNEIDKMNLSQIQLKQKLYLNWLAQNKNTQQYLYKAEYIYYSKKYQFNRPIPEQKICVLSPYRNLLLSKDQSYKTYLKSINQQNYSNYQVYMIDDVSDDGSVEGLIKEVMNYPRLRNRLTIVKNRENIGALGNRDFVTRNYCDVGALVLDIDGDDALIGRQVFNFVNRFYHNNPNAWFVYTNFLSILGSKDGSGRNINIEQKMQAGFCASIKQNVIKSNTYRTSQDWVTSLLRTYLRDLYIKIPLTHLLQQGTRKYYAEATDRFSMYALAQLAGQNHTFYVQQYTYFYFQPNYVVLQSKGCNLFYKFFAEAQARIITPLRNLYSLSDQVQLTKGYRPPDWVITLYERRRKQYHQCLQKYISKNYLK